MAAYGTMETAASPWAGLCVEVAVLVRVHAHTCVRWPTTSCSIIRVTLCAMRCAGAPTAPERTRRLVALTAGLCLCATVAIGTHLAASATPVGDATELWGGSDGNGPSLGMRLPAASRKSGRRSQLADFEPAKLYKDPPSTDLDHENRIDNYACMFSDCEGTKTPLLQTG